MQGQLASGLAQLASDQAALTRVQAELKKMPGWEATLNQLQSAYDSAQGRDAMFSNEISNLSLREQAHHASEHICQYATVPTEPVRPKKVVSILLSALIGLFVGVSLALLQDYLDDRLNSVEEAERYLGAPCLGQIPVINEDGPRLLNQMSSLASDAESYRVLRTNIHFASIDAPVSTLLVTSAGPGEGKTTTAINTAFAMAFDGKRVILVDTDLRRPSIHRILEVPSLPGLTDVLLGHASLEEALQVHKDYPNLLILPCGSTPPNPGELLNSRTFRGLVEELRRRCDIAIFDSAPVLVAADSAILASQLDGILFIVEGGSTKKGLAKRGLEILLQARSVILGIAYNKMSERDKSGYSYYNYNYQYRALSDEGTSQAPTAIVKRIIGMDDDPLASGGTAVLEDEKD